jgi:hypothetical protein
MITALALVAGSFVILDDPIFEGMAISLMAGVLVSTLLTLVVIPLGCISIGPKRLCSTGLGGDETQLTPIPANLLGTTTPAAEPPPAMPLWLSLWGALIDFVFIVIKVVTMAFYLVRAVFIIILWSIPASLLRSKPAPATSPPVVTPPPPAEVVPPVAVVIPEEVPIVTSPPTAEKTPVAPKEEVVVPPVVEPVPNSEVADKEEQETASSQASQSEEKTLTKKTSTAKKSGRRGIRLKSDLGLANNKSESQDEGDIFKPNGGNKDKK